MADTVCQFFERAALRHPARPALAAKRGGAWKTWTWAEHHDHVFRAARALVHLGVGPGHGAVIMGFNRPEWFWADLGAIHAGGVPAGIYSTMTPEQVQYIAHHCEAAVAVVENERYLETFERLRPQLPHIKAIVVMEGVASRGDVYAWDDFLRLADAVPESVVRERVAALVPGQLCTLIYTSGTTGSPKAVMLSHRNITFLASAVIPHFHLDENDRFISYLPLSHIAEQCVSLFMPTAVGGCTYFAESLEALPDNLREVRPTVFFGVPRVWEKIQARMQAVGAQAPALRRRIAAWARGRGLLGGYALQSGGRLPFGYGLAKKLVFDTVRERLGLDQARICLTSAAPISLGTLEFFLSLGIPILEVYGMSEVTGPGTLSTPTRYRTGRAGFAFPGTEIRTEDDGEILMRGDHVFLGYLKDEAATRETVDAEGWVHSGDVGDIDADGFVKVTDRKKELLITSGGKNVAPAPVEARLKTIPGVAQAVLVGDRRSYCAALLTLDPERVASVATSAGSPARTVADARSCPAFRAYLQGQIDAMNATLARFESVRKFDVLPGEMTIEGGELTPTMKLKRRVIREKYKAEIEALYS
jgi:long-subunit acyl-CoA synthetase (AMP-forming)